MRIFRILLLPALLASAISSFAQNSCGVFATQDDFLANEVTYRFDDCEVKRKLNKDLVAAHRGQKMRFDFRFIYGYFDGENLYRAYGVKNLWTDHGYYKIIYDKDLIIYQRTLTDYRSNTQTHYYFSTSKDSPILPLRKKFYSSSPEVSNSIKVYFSSLKNSINLPVTDKDKDVIVIVQAETAIEKKKPDISARLQTTTRRPKVFSVR
jgi:hypothetical protein